MQLQKAFPVAIIDEDHGSDRAAGHGLRQLAGAIEKEGYRVVGKLGYELAMAKSGRWRGVP